MGATGSDVNGCGVSGCADDRHAHARKTTTAPRDPDRARPLPYRVLVRILPIPCHPHVKPRLTCIVAVQCPVEEAVPRRRPP